MKFIFDGKANTFRSEIMTPYGLCFTFNIGYAQDLVNLNKTSSDFHYDVFQAWTFEDHQPLPLPELPLRLRPVDTIGLKAIIRSDLRLLGNVILNDFGGNWIMLHDPYELPTKASQVMRVHNKKEMHVLMHARINSIDESLTGYKPEE